MSFVTTTTTAAAAAATEYSADSIRTSALSEHRLGGYIDPIQ